MSKILVTGGAGFIGSNLVSELLKSDHEVSVIDDLSTGLISNIEIEKVEFHNIDIRDTKSLFAIENTFDFVVHLAARGSVPRSIINPIDTYQVNVTGTLNILEYCRAKKNFLIFSSSSSVYGANNAEIKMENSWLSPISPYAASKLAGEAFCTTYARTYEIPTAIFRFFNVYGPKQRPDHEYAAVIPKWIEAAEKRQTINVFGDGEQTRDFTFVGNVVETIIDVINRKLILEEPVNLAFGEAIELNHFIELLRNEYDELNVKYLPTREGDIRHSKGSAQKFNEIFPTIEATKFEYGIRQTIEWIRKNYCF